MATRGETKPDLAAGLRTPFGLFPAFDADVYVGHDGTISSLFEGSDATNVPVTRTFETGADARFTVSANGAWLSQLLDNGNEVLLRSLAGLANDEVPLALPWPIQEVSFNDDGLRMAGLTRDGRLVVWSAQGRNTWSPFFSVRYNGGQSAAVLLPATRA